MKLVPPPARFDTIVFKRPSGELVKSFEIQVVDELLNNITLYASLRATAAFCPTALTAAWREVQNPWSDEYTAPSLLLLCRLIVAVDGVFWRGRRSVELMEPDLQRISTPIAPKIVSIPVNYEDADASLEMPKIEIYKVLGNLHMESLPQNYRVPTREHMSIVGNVAQPHSLIRPRRGVEHGQSTIGWLGRVRRSRLMFRTWRTRLFVSL